MNFVLEFTWEQFENSPSRRDGISQSVELHFRCTTCVFIDAIGEKRLLPGRVRVIAMSLFQQFFMRASFLKFNRWEVGIACLCLAAKSKGHVKRVQDFVESSFQYWRDKLPQPQQKIVHAQRAKPDFKKSEEDRVYYWSKVIMQREKEVLLRLMGELRLISPHSTVKRSTVLECVRDGKGRALPERGNEFLKDCLRVCRLAHRSVVTLFYWPSWIGAAVIHLTVRMHNSSRETPKYRLVKGWWKSNVFDHRNTLDLNLLYRIEDEILSCCSAEETFGMHTRRRYLRRPAVLGGMDELKEIRESMLIKEKSYAELPPELQKEYRRAYFITPDMRVASSPANKAKKRGPHFSESESGAHSMPLPSPMALDESENKVMEDAIPVTYSGLSSTKKTALLPPSPPKDTPLAHFNQGSCTTSRSNTNELDTRIPVMNDAMDVDSDTNHSIAHTRHKHMNLNGYNRNGVICSEETSTFLVKNVPPPASDEFLKDFFCPIGAVKRVIRGSDASSSHPSTDAILVLDSQHSMAHIHEVLADKMAKHGMSIFPHHLLAEDEPTKRETHKGRKRGIGCISGNTLVESHAIPAKRLRSNSVPHGTAPSELSHDCSVPSTFSSPRLPQSQLASPPKMTHSLTQVSNQKLRPLRYITSHSPSS